MKVVVTGRPYRVAAEEDGAGEVVVGVGLVVAIGPGKHDKKYALNLPRRTRYRIG